MASTREPALPERAAPHEGAPDAADATTGDVPTPGRAAPPRVSIDVDLAPRLRSSPRASWLAFAAALAAAGLAASSSTPLGAHAPALAALAAPPATPSPALAVASPGPVVIAPSLPVATRPASRAADTPKARDPGQRRLRRGGSR